MCVASLTALTNINNGLEVTNLGLDFNNYLIIRIGIIILVQFLTGKESFGQCKDYFTSQKMQEPFSMATGNVELMHECSPEHLCKGTASNK